MSVLRSARRGSHVTQCPKIRFWVVNVMAGGVGLGCGAIPQYPEGRLWVVKFTAGRVGLGCDAIVPGRLWVVKFTGCDAMAPGAPLGPG